MKYLIMFLCRVLFMPFTVPALVLTAILEFGFVESDWDDWRRYNQTLIDLLPWSKYK